MMKHVKRAMIGVSILLIILSSILVSAEKRTYTQPVTGKEYTYDDEKKPYISYSEAGCNVTSYLFLNLQVEEEIKLRKKWQRDITARWKDAQAYIKYKAKELSISPRDLYDLSHLIYSENGTLGIHGMYNAGSVVINRKNSKHFPDTIHGVIYQKGQYAVTFDGAIDKEPSEEAVLIAKDLLINGSVLPENVVYQAEFVQGSGIYEQVGNTYYCYQ